MAEAATEDLDADPGVARDDFSSPGRRPADRVVGDADDANAVAAIAQSGRIPEASVPMKLPSTTLPVATPPWGWPIRTPLSNETVVEPFPEMRLPVPGAVPPMVLFAASMVTPVRVLPRASCHSYRFPM